MLTIHRLLPDGQLAPSGGVLWPSLPNPQVNVEQLAIENPRETSNDEGYLLCDLIISGSITSRLCNTIPGSDGTIEEVFFDVNDSEARQRFAIQVDKREDTAVASPFPFRGTFRFKIDDVPITEGNNIFTVSARDKVYGIDGHSSWAASFEYDPETKKVALDSPPTLVGGGHAGELFQYCLAIPSEGPKVGLVLSSKNASQNSFEFKSIDGTTMRLATWPGTDKPAFFTVRPTTAIARKVPRYRKVTAALEKNSYLKTLSEDKQFLCGFHQGLAYEGYDLVFDHSRTVTRAVAPSKNLQQLDITLPLSLEEKKAKPMVTTLPSPTESPLLKPLAPGALPNLHQHIAHLVRSDDPRAQEVALAFLIPDLASIGLGDVVVGDWSEELNSRLLGSLADELNEPNKAYSPVAHGFSLSILVGDAVRPYLDPKFAHRLDNTSMSDFLQRFTESPGLNLTNRRKVIQDLSSGYFATPHQ